MLRTKILVRRLGGFRVRIQRGLVLFQELLLHGNIVICDAEHSQAVLRLFYLLHLAIGLLCVFLGIDFGNQLVLDQDQRLHRVLKCQLVLAHLTENRADVQVNIGGVQNLEAVVHTLLAVVQIVILDLESLFEVAQSRPQLLRPPEDASEVVISNRSVLVSVLRKGFSFSQKLEGYVEVF